mmetsp:Transcript_31120/g.75118  ORF Transcript_31120/g.75118 Transcript_31120/m.75118 type:complete len:139 (+) Transcript_31120:22-438(+)
MCYFCLICSDLPVAQVMDPITETICMMVTSPIELTITEPGVTLFQNRHTHVYPYNRMNEAQKSYVRNTITRVLKFQKEKRESFAWNTQDVQIILKRPFCCAQSRIFGAPRSFSIPQTCAARAEPRTCESLPPASLPAC